MPPLPPIRNIRERLLKGPLKDGSFIRNVLTVIAGTAVSQGIAIAVIPILARVYSPENFGALAKYTVAVTILAAFASFSYQAAVVLPKRHESAFTLLISSLVISLTMCILAGLLIFGLRNQLPVWLDSPDLYSWLWIVPFGMLARSWYTAFQLWNTRNKEFANNAKGDVSKRLAGEGSKLGLGGAQFLEAGLLIGTLIGTLTGMAVMASKSLTEIPSKYWKKINFRYAVILLHRYRRFPMFDLFSGTVATISRNLPIIILSYFFSSAVVGFFFVAYKMVAGPLQLGATSVTQVFFQRANHAKKSGNLDEITIQVFSRLLIIFFTPLSLICIAAPEVTLLVLGSEWTETGVYLRWLSLWLFFTSIASPMHRIFAILERQNELAIINAAIFTVSTITLSIGGLRDDPLLALKLFATGVSIVWIMQGLRTLYISGVPLIKYFELFLREAIKTAPFAAVMIGTRYLTDSTLVVVAVFLACLSVFGLLRAKFILTRGKQS